MSAASIPALPHRWRLWALVIVTLLDLAALLASHLGVGPELVAEARPLVETGLTAVLFILLPALGDAYLVERRRRMPGIPALPDDHVETDDERMERLRQNIRVEPIRPPPSSGALGLALVVLAASLSVATSGCGASALGAQADLVAVGGIATAQADDVLVNARARDLDAIVDAARVECAPDGCDEGRSAQYRAELAATEERWAPVLACRAPVVEALRAWADGIETAHRAATDQIALDLLLALGARFVSAYGALASCLETAAPEVDLPALPSVLAGLGGAR